MRVLFVGGGTAGHMLPLATVIGELNLMKSHAISSSGPSERQARPNNNKILIAYIGEGTTMEKVVFKGLKIKKYNIKAGKFRRYVSFKNIIDVVKVPVGFVQSLKIINEFKPGIVFSKGGYVAVPVCYAAWIKKVPVVIHESDVIPGLATRLTARIADKVCLGWRESKNVMQSSCSCLPAGTVSKRDIFTVTGIPVRKNIMRGAAARAYKITGFSKNLPVTLVMGGSLGAAHINNTLREALPDLLRKTQVIHITGMDKKLSPGTVAPALRSRYFQTEFATKELADFYKIADIIVSRAGAGTCAELDVLGKPNILIPLGEKASRGDQIANADIMEKRGSAIIPDEKLSAKTLIKAVEKLLETPTPRSRASSIHKFAAKKIATIISRLSISKITQ